jgi:ribosomal protein L10
MIGLFLLLVIFNEIINPDELLDVFKLEELARIEGKSGTCSVELGVVEAAVALALAVVLAAAINPMPA